MFLVFTLILYCWNWGYVREIVITNNAAEILSPGEDVLIMINTQQLQRQSKLIFDCSDLKITDQSNNEYQLFMEGDCDNARTQFWIHMDTIPTGETTLLLYYGDSIEKGLRDTDWDGNTVYSSSCPNTHTLHDTNDDHRYPRGIFFFSLNIILGGTGNRGGQLTHTHTISEPSFPKTNQNTRTTRFTNLHDDGSPDFSSEAHVHHYDVDVTSANNLPSHYSLLFCDGPQGVLKAFQNSVEIFLSLSLPNSYTPKTELNDDNRFPYFDSDSVGDEHDQVNHDHDIDKSSDIENENPLDGIYDKNGGNQFSAENHLHPGFSGSMLVGTSVPSHYNVHFAMNTLQGDRMVEPGSVLILSSPPPKGYKLVDELNNDRFPRGSNANLEQYTDDVDHTHNYGLQTKTHTRNNQIKTDDDQTGRVCHLDHEHILSNLVSGTEDHIPRYFYVEFYQKIENVDIEVDFGPEYAICRGYPDYSSDACNTVGSCISPNICNCSSSLYNGDDCENCDAETFCAPHHICLTNFGSHDCFCEDGWEGSSCNICNETYFCNEQGISCDDSTGFIECECQQYYSGDYCEICDPDHFCNSLGTCENDGISIDCSCVTFFSGYNCEICDGDEFCNGQSSLCSYTNGEINCTCNDNFFGDECDRCNVTFFCDILVSDQCYNIDNVQDCNCFLAPGFYGDNCSIPFICFGYPSNDTSACSGHGECLANNYCDCEEGWGYFDNCSIPECESIASISTAVCNGNGDCVDFNECVCFPNIDYYGLYCGEYIPSCEFVSENEIEVVYVCDEQYLPSSPVDCNVVIQNVDVVGEATCQFNIPVRRENSDVLMITLGTGATVTGEIPNNILQVKSVTNPNQYAELIISPNTFGNTNPSPEVDIVLVVGVAVPILFVVCLILCIVFWLFLVTYLLLKKKKKREREGKDDMIIALVDDDVDEKKDEKNDNVSEKEEEIEDLDEETLLKEMKEVERREKEMKDEIEKKENEIKEKEKKLKKVKKKKDKKKKVPKRDIPKSPEKETKKDSESDKESDDDGSNDEVDEERKEKLRLLEKKVAHFKRTSLADKDLEIPKPIDSGDDTDN